MRAKHAYQHRQDKKKKEDSDGQLIVCDQDFGTAVERMVTLAISSPVWDTILEMILGQKGMKYSLDSLVESSMACMSQNQKGNLESYSNLVALSPSISKQCKNYTSVVAPHVFSTYFLFLTLYSPVTQTLGL